MLAAAFAAAHELGKTVEPQFPLLLFLAVARDAFLLENRSDALGVKRVLGPAGGYARPQDHPEGQGTQIRPGDHG